ncbi:hypothetical protein [Paraliomyxa miuraensis]|uniref:hypothetical protein n=1 Tax=Paraliomyxa miuraensis TaxID=376150 RepID=UPI0022572396|nr:hypothetical protein [Paraliomyxa miuraensis]MCX4239403.1 hypothetical protein [Paraliomyxa miuraensis]
MNAPFLTDLDPEIAVKGSIDPLGLLPLWGRYGRGVVGNLSLVASSARGFTTLLLGYHLARRIIDEQELPESRLVDLFLTFEQIAAYSRLAAAQDRDAPDPGILGLRRVRSRLAAGKRVPLGGGRDAQILSNQRAYGLWTLFSGPAQQSGLLVRKTMRLTDEAEDFVRRTAYPRLERAGLRNARSLLDLMVRGRYFEPRGRHALIAGAVAELHADEFSADEQAFYLERFACGGPSDPGGCQHQLWALMRAYNDEHDTWRERLSMAELDALIDGARREGHAELEDRLWRIRRFEQVIGPASLLFGYLQDHADERSVTDVAGDLQATWIHGLRHVDPEAVAQHLEPVCELHGEEGQRRFEQLAHALHNGQWAKVIELVLEQNAEVMARRGGGPWIISDGGVLQVRYHQEGGDLPEDPGRRLVHPYFITSVKSVGAQVLGKLAARSEDDD